jgi:4-azaleucine resistance transporter AzlC
VGSIPITRSSQHPPRGGVRFSDLTRSRYVTTRRATFAEGALAVAPMLAGVAPFGVIAGLTAVATGLSAAQAMAMSLTIFAGASQLATLQLLGEGALPAVAVLTALTINLRFAMYSASLAPHFHHLSPRWRFPLAYLLVDQNYAVTINRLQLAPRGSDLFGHWFFFGGGAALWLTWQVSSAVGIFMGGRIPARWSLDFAIPLVFMAVLVPALRHRLHVAAALVGGVVATVCGSLPYNLGIVVGALSGIATGVVLEEWKTYR